MTSLPQVCCRCRQMKCSHLGEFYTSHHRYSGKVWVCHGCLERPKVNRLRRPGKETHPESVARQTLEKCGFMATAEFPLGPFIFDFAIPRLRMLVEIDSKKFHSSQRKKLRDQQKTKLAAQEMWHIERLQPSERLSDELYLAIRQRANSLGIS